MSNINLAKEEAKTGIDPPYKITVTGLRAEDGTTISGAGELLLHIEMIDTTMIGEPFSEIEGEKQYRGRFTCDTTDIQKLYNATGGFFDPVSILASRTVRELRVYVTKTPIDERTVRLQSTGAPQFSSDTTI